MRITASEHEEQVALFEWASLQECAIPELRLLFAIPNGGLRNIIVAKKLKAEGVKSGIPDLFLAIARFPQHGLFIEMKKAGGKVKEKQQVWHRNLEMAGYRVAVCYGWEPAKNVILTYLGRKN